MEPIISKKGKVTLSERTTLQNVFVNVTVTFMKQVVTDEGTNAETVIGAEYPTEQVQVQFDAEKLAEISKVDVSAMLSEAIEKLKAKLA